MRIKVRMACAALVALCLTAWTAPAAAQVFTGRIDITVSDATGGVLPGVTVTIAGPQNATSVTDEKGEAHFLNLAPGMLMATDVLSVLVDAIPVEAAHVMVPDAGEEPPIFGEFRSLLGNLELYILRRFEFYDAARGPDVALVIATGERRIYANILLTIGVVPPS